MCYNLLMTVKVSRKNAAKYGNKNVKAFDYVLPKLDSSLVYAELSGEHGEIKTSKRSRIYYILDGDGQFVLNGDNIFVEKDDVIVIPPNTSYNYKAINSILKILLLMELFYVKKPKKK